MDLDARIECRVSELAIASLVNTVMILEIDEMDGAQRRRDSSYRSSFSPLFDGWWKSPLEAEFQAWTAHCPIRKMTPDIEPALDTRCGYCPFSRVEADATWHRAENRAKSRICFIGAVPCC